MGARQIGVFFVLLLAGLSACSIVPDIDIFSSAPPPPMVTVTPPDGEKPATLSVAPLHAESDELQMVLRQAGVGLRRAGDRQSLSLSYATLDPAAEAVLTRSLGVQEETFSDPMGIAAGDSIEIRTSDKENGSGFTLHVVPYPGRSTIVTSLEVAAYGRPRNGALLPVVRGRVPVGGTGSLLIVEEISGDLTFAAILRLDIPGAIRIGTVSAPESHRLAMHRYAIPNRAMSQLVADLGFQEEGGVGGLAVYRVQAEDFARARAALESGGEGQPEDLRSFVSPGRVRAVMGTLNLRFDVTFALADYSYETVVTVENQEGRKPERFWMNESDGLLLVGWSVAAPGQGLAALLTLAPTDR